LSLLQLDNVVNGFNSTVTATLSGVPSGPLNFYASRTNPPVFGYTNLAYSGSNPFVLELPTPSFWYVWPQDNNGLGAPAFCGARLSNNNALDEAGLALETLLEGNRQALDWNLQQMMPDLSFAQISYGVPANIIRYPAVIITNPRRASDRYGLSYLTRHRYSFSIAYVIQHQDEQQQLRNAIAIGEAGTLILNQQATQQINLPCGEVLKNCFAADGEYADFEFDEAGFYATASTVWTAESTTQDREH